MAVIFIFLLLTNTNPEDRDTVYFKNKKKVWISVLGAIGEKKIPFSFLLSVSVEFLYEK